MVRYNSKGRGSPASVQSHLPGQVRGVSKLDVKRLVDLDHDDVSVTILNGGKKAISPSTTLYYFPFEAAKIKQKRNSSVSPKKYQDFG